MNLKYIVDGETAGRAVKSILKTKLNLSERLIKKLKNEHKILCNNVPVYVNKPTSVGDLIEVLIDFVEECDDIIPEDIEIDILHEDDSLIIINKAPHIVVHPTFGHPSGTIANAIMFHLLEKGICKKVRPVSRLDRDTSGIIIFAKNQFVQEMLIRQMKSKTFIKEYLGIVQGVVQPLQGTIDLPIERKPGSIMLRHVAPTGAPSVTHYEVVEHYQDASYLKFSLETGRTHQIRVHCQAIGHPLIGDTLYSPSGSVFIGRQALHSQSVAFYHPFTSEKMVFTAPIPDDMQNLLKILKT
ncbi:MAG: RluA family pseudouridine synthase [Clostridia bacterium]|nr:RluA family pseudouridine synthase [Clostridia bacterium]